jgi:two-component system invasion response regulator UvrY
MTKPPPPAASTVIASSPSPIIDVAVVASSPLMLGGLTHVIDHADGLHVAYQVPVITALPGPAASAVIVIDILGVKVEATDYWSLTPEGAPIVALSTPENAPGLMAAVRGGVHALLSREAETADLLLAIRTARRGGLYLAPDMFGTVVAAASQRPDSRRNDLTRREIEALRYLAEGFTHGQISRRMGLTETTVSTYVKRIRHKLHAGNKAELTRRAIELGYVEPRQ